MIDYLDLGATRLHETSARSVRRVEGLTGPPAVRGDWVDRPESDGWIIPPDLYLTGRTIVIEGEVWGPAGVVDAAKIDSAWAEWATLATAIEAARTSSLVMTWRNAGGSVDKQASVRLAGEVLPALTEADNGPFIRYQLMLRAASPTWASTTEQNTTIGAPTADGGMPLPVVFPIPFGLGGTGGSVVVTNDGNAIAYPRLVVQGPISGPVIESVTAGLELRFPTLLVGAGQTLTVECDPAGPRSATVGGANVLGTLDWGASSFFGLPPNVAQTIKFYGIGGGYGTGTTLTVYWRNAYIS